MYSQLFELHAELLKALAHPRRLEIVGLLRECEFCVSDIYEMLDLPQANISQHLMILRDAGVVQTKREGKKILYCIADPRILEAHDLLRKVLIDSHKELSNSPDFSVSISELVPLAHDPVCNMRISAKTADFHSEYDGKRYFFCASGCLKKFEERPELYVKA